MALIRWEPFTWPRPFTRLPSLWEEEEWPEIGEGLTVYETDDDVVVEAVVAGVPEDKVEVTIEGGVVTIKAEHEESEEQKRKKKVVYREARKAKYLYTTNLPRPIQPDKAKAEVENGVVKVTIPKAPEAKPKRISVKAKKK